MYTSDMKTLSAILDTHLRLV
uniref:Uncharacterized protein n=1 Tax=Arundo donax TaxID=35708 RepID=A0A0A9AUK9_ARUDO